MGFLDFLGGATSGIGGLFGGAAKGIGNLASQGMNKLGEGGMKALGGLGGLASNMLGFKPAFGANVLPRGGGFMGASGGMGPSAMSQAFNTGGQTLGGGLAGGWNPFQSSSPGNLMQNLFKPTAIGASKKSGIGGLFGKAMGGIGKFANSSWGAPTAGLATLLGSQLIPNPKAPPLPDEFNQYMKMMQGGGTPGMQAAQNYNMNILSGQDQNAYNAAVEGVDQAFAQEMEQLQAAYRSARPGSDITTDAAFKRDSAELQQRYAQRKALVMAQVQQGAAQQLGSLGGQQMGGMQSGLEAMIGNQNTQLGMDYDKRSGFRNTLGNLGLGMFQGPMQMEMMKKLFGGG